MNGRLIIVMYHYVRDLKNSRHNSIKGLDIELFKSQISFLAHTFNIITMEEVIAAIHEGYSLPENSLLLTFDDGYIDHYTNVFPILSEYGLQGSFFIPVKALKEGKVLDVNKIHFILASTVPEKLISEIYKRLDYYRGTGYTIPDNKELFEKLAIANRFDTKEVIFIKRLLQSELDEHLRELITNELYIENVGIPEEVFSRELYMSYDQIKCMKRHGMYIGMHSYNHYWLGKLDSAKMKEDINKSLEFISDIIDTNNWVMNYPYGSYNGETIEYIKSRGCKLGLSSEVRIADITTDNVYALPRLDTNDFPPKSQMYKSFTK